MAILRQDTSCPDLVWNILSSVGVHQRVPAFIPVPTDGSEDWDHDDNYDYYDDDDDNYDEQEYLIYQKYNG